MKHRGIIGVVILFLLVVMSLIEPNQASSQNQNVGRKILYQAGSELWVTQENGSSQRKISLSLGSLVGFDWLKSGDAFWVDTFDYPSNQAFTTYFSPEGSKILSVPKPSLFPNDSPSGKYAVKSEEKFSQPLWTDGMVDPMTYRLVLVKDGQEIVLTDRSDGVLTWSGNEESLAFYERVSKDRIDLVVYYLEDGSNLTTWIEMENPFLYVLNNRYILLFRKKNTPSLWDLENNTFRDFSNVEIVYGGHGIPYRLLKLIDGKSKLIFSNFTPGSPSAGIYMLDLITGFLQKYTSEAPFGLDIAGEMLVYTKDNDLYVTDKQFRSPKKILSVPHYLQEVKIQPRVAAPSRGRKVLVLLNGMGTAVPEGNRVESVFPDYWGIIDDAMRLGIYHDVIIYSYAGGKMVEGRWGPVIGRSEASYQSITTSVQRLGDLLLDYTGDYPETTFDLLGYSLGGKVAWEHLKTILGREMPYRVGRLITLNSPINGRHRDSFFQVIGQALDKRITGSKIADELNTEASGTAVQILVDADNARHLVLAERDQVLVYMMASVDDCFVPYLGVYPYNSAIVTENGILYKGLGRGTRNGLSITNCPVFDDFPLDLRDAHTLAVLIGNQQNPYLVSKAIGHDRILWHYLPWIEIKDLLLNNKTPRGTD